MATATLSKQGESVEEVLGQFLAAAEGRQAERLLERLIQEYADPVIDAVVRRKMEVYLDYRRRLARAGLGAATGRWRAPQSLKELDAEDVHASSRLSLLEHLVTLKGDPEASPIQDFRAYVGRIALNAFGMHMRQRYPERHRLRRKLWYLAQDHTPATGFALWPGRTPAEQLCGFRPWAGQPRQFSRNYGRWQDDPRAFRVDGLGGSDRPLPHFAELVAGILNWVGGPMDVDDMVNGLVELLGMRETEPADG